MNRQATQIATQANEPGFTPYAAPGVENEQATPLPRPPVRDSTSSDSNRNTGKRAGLHARCQRHQGDRGAPCNDSTIVRVHHDGRPRSVPQIQRASYSSTTRGAKRYAVQLPEEDHRARHQQRRDQEARQVPQKAPEHDGIRDRRSRLSDTDVGTACCDDRGAQHGRSTNHDAAGP